MVAKATETNDQALERIAAETAGQILMSRDLDHDRLSLMIRMALLGYQLAVVMNHNDEINALQDDRSWEIDGLPGADDVEHQRVDLGAMKPPSIEGMS